MNHESTGGQSHEHGEGNERGLVRKGIGAAAERVAELSNAISTGKEFSVKIGGKTFLVRVPPRKDKTSDK